MTTNPTAANPIENPLSRGIPRGGNLVEWRLANPEWVRTTARRHPIGPSFLQYDHIVAAAAKILPTQQDSATVHRNTAVTGVVTWVPEVLNKTAMADALTDFVRRHDELRCFFEVTDDGPVRYLVPPAAIEFVTDDIGESRLGHALVDYIVDRIETTTGYYQLPGFTFGAADSGDGFALYFGADHSHSDGYSQMLAIDEIVTLYRYRLADTPSALPPTASFLDFVAAEQARAAIVSPEDPRIDVWRKLFASTGGVVPRFPLDLGLADEEPVAATRVHREVLSAEEAAACDRRADSFGVSFTAVVYASLAATEYELTGRTSYFTATVLSTRTPAQARTQGWLCNFAPVAFVHDPDGPIDELVHTAASAVRQARELSNLPVHAALGILAAEGRYHAEAGAPQMVSTIDFRRMPNRDDPAMRAAEAFAGLGPTRNANMWINRYETGVDLAAQIPATAQAREATGRYFDIFVERMRKFAAG
ncbi:hypothetical protein GOEFS_128_00210 [Gordonia effusa NBRC 100432]|uniref:Condensation domain-containing protein n=1 Tax=Gordonia effusa NBRC 100432 TaxID=1077974 RepID=H0R6Q2_9ACTN|nr:condensation domain-containing protein [Gordonia effusa]GAB20753.1 hypothetical protein GOEFS_128_00210 [Gordonia effusa NBRC 100432]